MNRLRRNNLAIVWLALAGALLLRSLMPTGWMPMVDNGAIRIMLCDGFGPVELSPPVAESPMHDAHSQHGGAHQGGHHENAAHDPCPYGLALGSAFDLLPAPQTLTLPAMLAHIDAPARIFARMAARRSIKPPATGPPVLA